MREDVSYCCDKNHDERLVLKSEYPLWFELSNIKHRIRLKVLHKLHYSQRDTSATLVGAVFKLMKVQRKPSLNTKWRQISTECFHFSEQKFPRICLNEVPLVSVQHFLLSIDLLFAVVVPNWAGPLLLPAVCGTCNYPKHFGWRGKLM